MNFDSILLLLFSWSESIVIYDYSSPLKLELELGCHIFPFLEPLMPHTVAWSKKSRVMKGSPWKLLPKLFPYPWRNAQHKILDRSLHLQLSYPKHSMLLKTQHLVKLFKSLDEYLNPFYLHRVNLQPYLPCFQLKWFDLPFYYVDLFLVLQNAEYFSRSITVKEELDQGLIFFLHT